MAQTARKHGRIYLDVIREGKRLSQNPSSDERISINFENDSVEVVIGRLEILSAQHKSCRCDDYANIGSTKGKCDACSAVNDWAATGLSRRLLKFTCAKDFGGIFVQARGAHASVHHNVKLLASNKDDWSKKSLVHCGSILTLAPTQKAGKTLELRLEIDGKGAVGTQAEKCPSVISECSQSTHIINGLPPTETGGRSTIFSDEEKKSSQPQISLRSEDTSSKTTMADARPKRKTKNAKQKQESYSIFFVPLGHDMSSIRRKFLAKKAQELGVTISNDIFRATHVVISSQVSTLREVSETLPDVSESSLRSHIEQNDIPCLLPNWIASAKDKTITEPQFFDRWHGDLTKRHRNERSKTNVDTGFVTFPRNKEIAELFRKLSNLHQSCPLLASDQWKAYMFRIIAGRLTHLDFDIRNDAQTMNRLCMTPGIGSNSVDKIKEYLETGTVGRIQEFNSDPKRIAMKNMMNIWGVGRKSALDLVQRGFQDINDVRSAISDGKHFLDRNQLVGVDCYEDILEEMTRKEVKAIGSAVEEVVHEVFPGAEIRIMGSYRRQKATCGDIDVHITDKAYVKKNPPHGLSRIVDLLWERGKLIYHLTLLPGMLTGSDISDYMKASRHIPGEAWKLSKSVGYMTSKGHHGSSYMGVFRSPTLERKRRRIDLKFYPWRERVFASLYFTGNGYFNRSMRLWAYRKFRYTLNDHGLFFTGTQDRVMEANDESEVFEKLNLVYREPHERDSFDAVISKEGHVDLELTQAEFQEDKNYTWVD